LAVPYVPPPIVFKTYQIPLQLAYQQPGEKKKLRINPDIVGFGELGENRKEG
jgi:hypothetical protein